MLPAGELHPLARVGNASNRSYLFSEMDLLRLENAFRYSTVEYSLRRLPQARNFFQQCSDSCLEHVFILPFRVARETLAGIAHVRNAPSPTVWHCLRGAATVEDR